MRFDEIAPHKPLSPEQARLKSMKDRVKQDQEAVKAERARQKIQAGQQDLAKIESTQNMSSPSFKALYKMNNPYTSWMVAGTYGNFNNALAAALAKKKMGAVAVQILNDNKAVVYSS